MHREILTKNQTNLLFIPQMFSKNFGLVGGTAIALQIGHRHSIDFDLFTNKPFSNFNIKKRISKHRKIKDVFKDEDGHYTFIIEDVQFTFFYYPYPIIKPLKKYKKVSTASIPEIAAMKALSIGRRLSYKDYVDWYFLLSEKHIKLQQVIRLAQKKFNGDFNSRLFLSQLISISDVPTLKIDFLRNPVDRKTVEDFLVAAVRDFKI